MFFMPKVIEVLSQGNLFKSVCATAMRVMAWLVVIVGFLAWCGLWMTIKNLQGFQVVGLLLHQCVYVVFIYMVAHALIIHAEKIQNLPEADFVIIPIISRVFKLMGDLSAVVCVYWGAFIFLMGASAVGWLGGPLRGMGGGDDTSIGSLMFSGVITVALVMIGFLWLLFYYWLSEITIVLADMAINMKRVRMSVEMQPAFAGASAPGSSWLPPEPEPAAIEPPKCPQCQTVITETTKFCRECGYKIK